MPRQRPMTNNENLTLSILESHLWEAANILRGSPVDRTDWKSYILPLMFFKRICDVWDEEYDEAVNTMIEKLPAEVAEDFSKLADEAVKPKPNMRWYSVSIEGLIKAAENLDKLGTPVISLSQKVLSLLTGGRG